MSTVKVCNMCGKELSFCDRDQNFSIHSHFGYGSEHDGDILDLDLCRGCMETLIKACVIRPVIDRDEWIEEMKAGV